MGFARPYQGRQRAVFEVKEVLMQEELEQCRSECLILCGRLLYALEENRDDAHSFFSGKLYEAYDTVTDQAKNKVQKIKNKIRNL